MSSKLKRIGVCLLKHKVVAGRYSLYELAACNTHHHMHSSKTRNLCKRISPMFYKRVASRKVQSGSRVSQDCSLFKNI